MSKELSAEIVQEIKIDLPSLGLGTMRTSETYIYALLKLENDEDAILGILADVAELFGISGNLIQEKQDDKMCSKCGGSLLHHRLYNDGKCN
ncbi:MAG: hypothetical protein PHX80_03630 [Candidatus Nanoarchaeia archaeon]|nr:hypothetical protein [Candidatus Nanoarchaeia archaeon]